MAFTGAPVVDKIGKYTARITGVSLASAAAGTIGLDGSGAEAELPESFPSQVEPGDQGGFSGLVQVRVNSSTGGGQMDIRVNKTVSTVFPITLTNAGAGATGSLEIIVEYLTSQER